MEFENLRSVNAKTRRKSTRGDQLVDIGIHVLDSRVRQHHRRRCGRRRGPTGFDKDRHAVQRRKRLSDPHARIRREKLSITACT